jgi:hypothetical protein
MHYKTIDFVALLSVLFGAAAVLGIVALTFGPWGGRPSGQTAYTILSISWLVFWLIGMLANSAAKILSGQADQIAALERDLAEQRSRA